MRAMVLAAGLGLRMRPITDRLPKPMIAVAGRAMLDRVFDHLDAFGIERRVVNLHHLGHIIRDHLAGRADVDFSDEPVLLETGGGVAKALPLLGRDPFLVANADIVWLDGPTPALGRMAAGWDDAAMDALLLLHPAASAFGYSGRGDFFLDERGVPRRPRDGEAAPFIFAGVQILKPELFRDVPEGPFSLNLIYDRALAAGRLRALVHDGKWFHVGTPAALDAVHGLVT